MSTIRSQFGVLSGLVLLLAFCTAAHAQGRFFPAPGTQEEYRLRLGAYSADGAPTLVTAMNLRLTALDERRLQLDVLKVERYDPFGQIWLNLIVDSIHSSREGLPEDVQARLVLEEGVDLLGRIPDDIPDAAFGLLLEATMILHVPFLADGLADLEAPGEKTSVDDVSLQWTRARTQSDTRREGRGGTVTLESHNDNVAVLRWEPGPIRWASLFRGPQNRASLGREIYELALVVDTETGAIVSATTLNDFIEMNSLGIVDYDVLPDWDELTAAEDSSLFNTTRVIKLQRLQDYLNEMNQKDAPPVMGPLVPGDG